MSDMQRSHTISATAPCERCEQFDEVHGPQCPEHPDYDPTPWCGQCGAKRCGQCTCAPVAENN